MKPRGWFRFRLRTLFVLLTVFGIVLAWVGVQVKWIRDRREFLATYLDEGVLRSRSRLEDPASYPTAAPWSIRVLGETGTAAIFLPRNIDTQERERIQRLFPEAKLYVVAGLAPRL